MALQINLGSNEDPIKQHIKRLATLARIFTTANRILSGDSKLKCTVANNPAMPAPSWTDGQTITFNADQIKNIVSLEDVIQVTGLNYHELAHVLYTPRYSQELGLWVANEKLNRAYNMLEDQRIETMLTSLYPATIPYFTATVTRYLAEDKTQWERNFLLTHGRKYLPITMREAFEAKFFKPRKRKAIKAIVDEYRLLVFPDDTELAKELIIEFNKILVLINNGTKNQQVVGDPFGHADDSRPTITQGQGESSAVQVEIQEAVESVDEALAERDEEVKQEKAQEKEDTEDDNADTNDSDSESTDDSDSEDSDGDSDDDSDDTSNDSDSSDSSGDTDSEEEKLDDSDSDSEDDSDSDLPDAPAFDGEKDTGEEGHDTNSDGEVDGEDSSDSDSSDDSDSSSSGASTESNGNTPAEDIDGSDSELDELDSAIAEAIAEANEEILANPDVLAESSTRKNTMIEGDGEVSLELVMHKLASRKRPIDSSYLNISDDLAVELGKIKASLDPFWEDEKDTGRFNVRQYIRGVEDDKVFDKYHEGNVENTDIEAVILVDVSGSMLPMMDRACRSVWAIKRALEKIDGKVTVIAFSDDSYVMYDRNELADDSTIPTTGLRSAIEIFNASEHNNKILFVITDGSWGYGGSPVDDDLIQRMNEGGVHTALAYLSIGFGKLERHNCQYAQIVNDPIGLVNIAEEIAIQAMQQV